MRKVILKISVTVDGFVGAADGNLDWIFPTMSEDAAKWTFESIRHASTHIMGHATYLGMAAHWPNSTESFAAPMNEIPKVVFSDTLKNADWAETRIMRGALAEGINQLKHEQGGDIVAHGGSRFAQSLSSQGLIDEYRLLIHPVALGSGLPLFASPIHLQLVSAETFNSGAVAHVYRAL